MVSMARPLLADAEFVRKAGEGAPWRSTRGSLRPGVPRSRLQPEGRFRLVIPAPVTRRSWVPAGRPRGSGSPWSVRGRPDSPVPRSSPSVVTTSIFEAAAEIGGQFRTAMRVPARGFAETLWYFQAESVDRRHAAPRDACRRGRAGRGRYVEVVVAMGVVPRSPCISGQDDPTVLSDVDALLGGRPVGSSWLSWSWWDRVRLVEFLVHGDRRGRPGGTWRDGWRSGRHRTEVSPCGATNPRPDRPRGGSSCFRGRRAAPAPARADDGVGSTGSVQMKDVEMLAGSLERIDRRVHRPVREKAGKTRRRGRECRPLQGQGPW